MRRERPEERRSHVKRVRERLKAVRSATLDHPRLLRWRMRREALRVAALGRSVRPGTRHQVLLAPTGGGNIGDQAMVEAYLENVPGDVVIIARHVSDVDVPEAHRERVRLVGLGSLVAGSYRRDDADLRTFCELLDGARGFSVIGADMLDGAYSYRRSVQRTSLATYAARCGIPTRILGFSWNAAPDRRCLDELAAAADAGVRLLARDPVSVERLRASGFTDVVETADLVFAARTLDDRVRAELRRGRDGPYALVNASSLVARKVDQLGEYERIVTFLRARGMDVILVPHDSRPTSDDVAECRKVYGAMAGDGVYLVGELLSPAQIRGLTRSARIVVSGRMHLAIMSLYNAVPAVTVSTQGKVEGLMRRAGVENLMVELRRGFGHEALAVLDDVLAREQAVRDTLREGVAGLKTLASRNFVGML